jgi:DNA polymerase-1
MWRDELWAAKKECLKVTGLDDLTGHKLATWLEANLPSDVLAMWPRTDKTDKLKTDSHVFADFGYLDIVEPFEKYQKAYKLTSSFGDSLIGKLNPKTKRIHPSYKICGARTGRLSCTNPNLQQIPRPIEGDTKDSIRDSFISGQGFTFVCADYSQIELRVGAALSGDEQMLDAYRRGIDLHSLTASQILRKRLEDVTKQDRQLAKAYNFGLMFGLGANKFSHYARKSYGVEVTHKEATSAIETFRETYSGYRDWQLKQAEASSTSGTCVTPCGKLRKLPRDNIYGNSMNHPVQGGAAEVVLHALIRVNKLGLRLVNCVHDEIMIEVPDNSHFEYKNLLATCMVEGFLDVFPGGITKGLVETGIGETWAKAK